MYVGDDGFAFLQVGGSEPVERQHDERRTDETEKQKQRHKMRNSTFGALTGSFKSEDCTEKQLTILLILIFETYFSFSFFNHLPRLTSFSARLPTKYYFATIKNPPAHSYFDLFTAHEYRASDMTSEK